MVTLKWIDEQLAFLTSRLGIYRLGAVKDFFFDPTPGFYGFISQGSIEALNKAMSILAEHTQSPTKPIIEEWEGPENPLVSGDFDWTSYNEPPGLIKYNGPNHSRIHIGITNKHSPLILGGILAHELTHHFLLTKGIYVSDVDENERLTDLATVYIGLGKLTLNGYKEIEWTVRKDSKTFTYTYRVGYLSDSEIAMIVNRVCDFRGIPLDVIFENLTEEAIELLQYTREIIKKQEMKINRKLRLEKFIKQNKERLLNHVKKLSFPFTFNKKDIDTDTSTKKSHHNQLIITCGKCGQKMRVPKLEKDIKVKCPNPNCCNEFLLKGKAI